MNKYLKRSLQSLLLCLVTVFTASGMFVCANAASSLIEQSDVTTLFMNMDTSVYADEESYPYNIKGSVSSVGFDVKFGTKRDLVYYSGEVPYYATRAGSSDGKVEDDAAEGFTKFPYNRYKMDQFGNGTRSKAYWGDGFADTVQTLETTVSDGASGAKISTFEEAAENQYSLRIYALSIAKKISGFSGIIISVKNFGYRFFIGAASLAASIVNIVIQIKNISMSEFLAVLNLDDLQTTLNTLFVKSETGQLSPFALICIGAFIVNVVAFVWNYVRGGKKEKNLISDIILIALAGLAILGAGLTEGGALSLGTSISDFIAATANEVANASSSSNIWTTKTSGEGASSAKDTQYTETSMINKLLIDTQICTQFGVNDITALDDSKLKGNITNAGSSTTVFSACGNNIGYYFWYADSGAKNATSNSGAYTLDASGTQRKMAVVVSYLQTAYDAGQKNVASKLIRSLCEPSTGVGIIKALMLMIIYGLLAICLAKYAIQIAVAKLSLLAGAVGLSISGLLIISTNKKMTSLGKAIIATFVLSFLKVTVLSIFFDMILFIIGQIANADMVTMIITMVLLFLFAKLNPIISEKIDALFKDMERVIAPELGTAKAAFKRGAQRKIQNWRSSYNNWSQKHGKIMGVDENGNAIRKSSRGGILDTAFEIAENSVSRSGLEKQTFGGLLRKQGKLKKDENDEVKMKQQNAGSAMVKGDYDTAISGLNDAVSTISKERDAITDDLVKYGSSSYGGHSYSLTSGEITAQGKALGIERQLDTFNSNEEYQQLLKRRDVFHEQLSDAEKDKLDKFEDERKNIEDKLAAANNAFKNAVNNRVAGEVTNNHKDELNKAIDNARAESERFKDTAASSAAKSGLKTRDTRHTVDDKYFENQAKINILDSAVNGKEGLTKGNIDEYNKAKSDTINAGLEFNKFTSDVANNANIKATYNNKTTVVGSDPSTKGLRDKASDVYHNAAGAVAGGVAATTTAANAAVDAHKVFTIHKVKDAKNAIETGAKAGKAAGELARSQHGVESTRSYQNAQKKRNQTLEEMAMKPKTTDATPNGSTKTKGQYVGQPQPTTSAPTQPIQQNNSSPVSGGSSSNRGIDQGSANRVETTHKAKVDKTVNTPEKTTKYESSKKESPKKHKKVVEKVTESITRKHEPELNGTSVDLGNDASKLGQPVLNGKSVIGDSKYEEAKEAFSTVDPDIYDALHKK